MKRRLRLSGTWLPEGKVVLVKVLQRHYNDIDFSLMAGSLHITPTCCFLSDRIYSGRSPKINRTDKRLDIFLGTSGSTFTATLEQWNLIKGAVDHYNSTHEGYDE